VADNGTRFLVAEPFLDEQSSGTEYSTRSANAFAGVADAAPDRVWDFHTALYEQQPAEGSQGLSDEQIAKIAADAGVPADVVDGFTDDTFRPWVASVTREAFDSGVQGTPTVKIDGEVFEGNVYAVGPLTNSAVGIEIQNRQFSALGDAANYLLPTLTQNYAGFFFTEMPVGQRLHLQASSAMVPIPGAVMWYQPGLPLKSKFRHRLTFL